MKRLLPGLLLTVLVTCKSEPRPMIANERPAPSAPEVEVTESPPEKAGGVALVNDANLVVEDVPVRLQLPADCSATAVMDRIEIRFPDGRVFDIHRDSKYISVAQSRANWAEHRSEQEYLLEADDAVILRSSEVPYGVGIECVGSRRVGDLLWQIEVANFLVEGGDVKRSTLEHCESMIGILRSLSVGDS